MSEKIKTELQEIREEFEASRPQFGKVFLGGVSKSMLYLYETGKAPIPERVMMLARYWRAQKEAITGKSRT